MNALTELIRNDMKPALGVTEPGAIAFAVSTARSHTSGNIKKIELSLNSGMYKNAFTCGIPGSPEVGNYHAAALGAAGADPSKGLECLEGITPEQAAQAREIIATVSAEKAANLPEQMVQNIANGRVQKFLKENTLENQDFVQSDEKISVADYIKSIDKDAKVVAFRRYSLND